jgi:hypothetical protein
MNDLGYLRLADAMNQKSEISFNENTPKDFYRNYSLSVGQQSDWDFGGRLLQTAYDFSANITLKNDWFFDCSTSRTPEWRDTRLLRGGPALTLDGNWNWGISIRTDSRKKLSYSLKSQYIRVDDGISRNFTLTPGLVWRIGTQFNFSSNISYLYNIDDAQYIYTNNFNNSNRYILGRIEQNTWTMTFRADYAFTPNLILQYYVNPFISSGSYSHIKYVADADAEGFDKRYHTFSGTEIINMPETNSIAFDENGNGSTDYSINNPDFNFFEMYSNLVLRWEYTPGSTLYFVWTNSRSDYINESVQSMSNNADRLFTIKPQNIFMMKLNYWFTL